MSLESAIRHVRKALDRIERNEPLAGDRPAIDRLRREIARFAERQHMRREGFDV